MDGNRLGLERAFRIDDLVEDFLAQQAVVDDARRADLDDLVALRRLQPGRLGIEHGVGEFAELAVEIDRTLVELEQVEVVILRPAGDLALLDHHFRIRRRDRQHEAEIGAMRRLLALVPNLAAVPVDHVAQGERRGIAADLHAFQLPGIESLGGHRRAGPDQVEIGEPAFAAQAEAQFARFVVILQAAGQEDQREDQRETVRLEPQAVVHFLGLDRQLEAFFNTPAGGGNNIDAENVLERPARLQRIRELAHRLVDRLAALGDLVVDDVQETAALFRLHVRVVEQVGDRGADVGDRRTAALAQRMQRLVALFFFLDAARDVVDGQHVARHARLTGLADARHDRHHLDAQ